MLNLFLNFKYSYVCQLQRLTIKFCKSSHTSSGVRDYIENGLLNFSRQNPGVAIYMKPRLHRTPVIVTEYLNGHYQWMSVRNFTKTELEMWMETLRSR